MAAMSDTILFIHPLCYSSYKLVKNAEKDIREKGVRLVSIHNPVESGALSGMVVSVPYLTREGKPLAVDPLDAGELRQILESGEGFVYEPWKMLARSILASGYLTSLALVHDPRELPRLLPSDFVEASLRSNAGGPRPSNVAGDPGFWERVWTRFWEKASLVVAYNMARHTYWSLRLLGKTPSAAELQAVLEGASAEDVARWIIAMSSLGRAGNPRSITGSSEGEWIAEASAKAVEHLKDPDVAHWIVEEEQGVIEKDKDFWSLLKELEAP